MTSSLSNHSLQNSVVEKVRLCFVQATSQLNYPFVLPKVSFNQRGKIAGCARLQKNELRFNPVLLVDNPELFLDEVVPHEVCHLLAHDLYGRVRPHGKEWQSLMQQLFDLPGQTYHQMDVTKVKGKSFAYRCNCGLVELSIRRHNKVIRGKQQYICRKCHTTLTAT